MIEPSSVGSVWSPMTNIRVAAHRMELSFRRYAGESKQGLHTHEFASVTLLLAGGLRERCGRGDVVAQPLSLSIKPAGVPHADHYGRSGALTFQVRLPAAAHDDPELGPLLDRWRWTVTPEVVRTTVALAHAWKAGGSTADVSSLFAALRNEHDDEVCRGIPPRWLARAVEYFADGIADGGKPVVAAAARVAGVHPVHLARVFQRHLGCTPLRWMQRQRARYAAGALVTSGRRVGAIAHEAGFADHSHLTRVFRQHAGIRPSEYARLGAT
jgi:AraC family transcriptional regulator